MASTAARPFSAVWGPTHPCIESTVLGLGKPTKNILLRPRVDNAQKSRALVLVWPKAPKRYARPNAPIREVRGGSTSALFKFRDGE